MADFQVTSGYDGINLPYSPEAEQSVLGAVLLGFVLPGPRGGNSAARRIFPSGQPQDDLRRHARPVHPGPAG